MKTLDEVIAALEEFGEFVAECNYCSAEYCGESYEMDKCYSGDALHYLKEYRETKKHLACLDDAEIRGDDTQVVNNPPLTWDELIRMADKPVWLEEYDPIDEKTGWHTASWKLIEFINDEYFDVRDSDGEQECFYKSENDWKAYRKERS